MTNRSGCWVGACAIALLTATTPAAPAPRHAGLGTEPIAWSSPLHTSAVAKPISELVAVRSDLARGKIRIEIAALASRVKVKYQTRAGKKRTIDRKLRGGRASIVLPAGAQGILLRTRATRWLAASRWTTPVDSAPETVGIPQGTSYWVAADSVLVVQRNGSNASLVESNGSEGYCAVGQLTGNIWTVKRDFADSDRVVPEQFLVSYQDPQLYLTPDRQVSWASGNLDQADQALRSLNEYADPADTLTAKCGFEGRRWR